MTPLFRDRCNNSTNGIFITHSSLFQLQFDKIKIRRAGVGGVMRHSVTHTSLAGWGMRVMGSDKKENGCRIWFKTSGPLMRVRSPQVE